MRTATITRNTKETQIKVKINLDGDGAKSKIETGIGFLDHMLELFSRHSGIEMTLSCKGDTRVDGHHSTEDIGIVLGQAVEEALGDKKGIKRFADVTLPMDETLVLTAIDISGRGASHVSLAFETEKIGEFDTQLVGEFLEAFATNAGITLHVRQLAGHNSHHIAEACFKGLGRALREAVETDVRFAKQIPSTKGTLAGNKKR